jgi:hypothetical protein
LRLRKDIAQGRKDPTRSGLSRKEVMIQAVGVRISKIGEQRGNSAFKGSRGFHHLQWWIFSIRRERRPSIYWRWRKGACRKETVPHHHRGKRENQSILQTTHPNIKPTKIGKSADELSSPMYVQPIQRG